MTTINKFINSYKIENIYNYLSSIYYLSSSDYKYNNKIKSPIILIINNKQIREYHFSADIENILIEKYFTFEFVDSEDFMFVKKLTTPIVEKWIFLFQNFSEHIPLNILLKDDNVPKWLKKNKTILQVINKEKLMKINLDN